MTLEQEHCVPCEKKQKPLGHDRNEILLKEVNHGWAIIDDKKLERHFAFKDFKETLDFVNKVGDIAESEGHHPDMNLYSWNKLTITLFTHNIGGLSENDFILAAKINSLLQEKSS
ncbi:4a-hydroxytetrahydrobiopterin dehydratase [Candidatus Parcubacteria bacterium]|nr:4a-hydroxytetrahydrobiopterin dehydratase [Candidatus Parcubacteria bacterium]